MWVSASNPLSALYGGSAERGYHATNHPSGPAGSECGSDSRSPSGRLRRRQRGLRESGVGDGALRKPANWRHLTNPFRPSWGEPYIYQVVRMTKALDAAAAAARGQEAVLVSHQLPIWTVRSYVERRRLWHDPRRRQCSLASLTSFTYRGDRIVSVGYSEPARDLVPEHLLPRR